jgi:hypothetical protein
MSDMSENHVRQAHHDILHEAIVGAFGLPPGQLQVSIKGDPSLRETVPIRQRYQSRMDEIAEDVLTVCDWLLRRTGVYAIYVGFNSSEVRTESVFNPCGYEIHDAESLVEEGYIERHFVRVPFIVKMQAVRALRDMVQCGPMREYLPEHWQQLMDRQREEWEPLEKDEITAVVRSLITMRRIESYYLRNAAISVSQRLVRASFNCDGTYIVDASYFPRFVAENTPDQAPGCAN